MEKMHATRSDSPGELFRSRLALFQTRWRTGLFSAGLLRAVMWAALAFLALGVFDYYAGFSDDARRIAAAAIAVAAICGALLAAWETFRCSASEAATEADRTLATGRREILSALELSNCADAVSPLAGWLRERAVGKAASHIGALDLKGCFPRARLALRSRRLLSAAALISLFILIAPSASNVIALRLLHPNADIPPYSPLRFAVGPRPAEVLYGGEIVVTAEISGGNIQAPVRCLTRNHATGRIEESPAFRENAARFSQKLEKVAEPVDVAFAVGRARSRWMPVAVRTQPKVQEILLTIEPPAYSGLPRREFVAGSQELAALVGSRITARVTSNRTLSSGLLRIHGQSAGASLPDQDAAAEIEGAHQARFAWELRGPARLTLEIRDVAGTVSEPVRLDQKLVADERPDVVLRQPGGDVLATPDSELPLEISASDDLGLARLVLVRCLAGYRERSQSEPIQTGARRFDLDNKLHLARFGLVPGQTIELTAEATDTNPTLLGVGVSEPSRIHIIASEQYAQMLRSRTTLEDFAARYAVLRETIEAARKSVDELEKAAASGDAPRAEAARQKSLEAHQNAAKTFGQIARDFPIFDLDAGLGKASEAVAESLFENGKQLQDLWRSTPKELGEAVPQLRERLGASEKELSSALQKGERAAAAGKVFEQAGRFNELLTLQRGLVKDFNRILEQIRRGEMQAGRALGDLARKQRDVAAGLRTFEKDLEAALEGLPEEFAKMKSDGNEFLEAFRELAIPPVMDEGVKAGEAGDGKTAGDRADEALSKMEALLRRKNGFCEMCRGDGAEKFPWPEDLAQTLEQLMQSLIRRPGGSGDGEGKDVTGDSGAGFSGRSDSGYAMKGKLPDLPIYGPPRSRLSRNAGPDLAGGGQGGNGRGNPEAGAEVRTSNVGATSTKTGTGEAQSSEAVPEAYREALKRYFSTADEPAAAAPAASHDPKKP